MCVEKAELVHWIRARFFVSSLLMQFVIKSSVTHTKQKSLPLNLAHLRQQHKRQLIRAVKINYAHTTAIYDAMFFLLPFLDIAYTPRWSGKCKATLSGFASRRFHYKFNFRWATQPL